MDVQRKKPDITHRTGPLRWRAGRSAATPASALAAPEADQRRVKLTVVGDGTVGKTCLLFAYVNKRCPSEEYIPTVFENSTMDVRVEGGGVQLSLWDTAGQEEYSRLRRLIYPSTFSQTDIFLLCYAVNNPSSFQNITSKWWPELRYHCPSVPILIVATKSDLRTAASSSPSDTTIDGGRGRRLSKKLRAAGFLECSAKTYAGVSEVFETALASAVRGVPRRGAAQAVRECVSRRCTLL